MPIRPSERARYPKNWRAISLRIRERENNACKWCGAKNGERHPDTGSRVVLTVAHLDHTPEHCTDDNLAALCQRCHNRYDAPMRRRGMRDRMGMLELPLPSAGDSDAKTEALRAAVAYLRGATQHNCDDPTLPPFTRGHACRVQYLGDMARTELLALCGADGGLERAAKICDGLAGDDSGTWTRRERRVAGECARRIRDAIGGPSDA